MVSRFLMICVFLGVVFEITESCVPNCICTMLGSKGKQKKGRKVECSKPGAPFKSLGHINFPLDTVFLGLNENELSILKSGSFNELSNLVKLNLSMNRISIIEPGAFQGLSNLKKVDLSNNKIGTINSTMFTGLPKLEKLSLANNRINTIPEGTFNDLTSLRRVEFGSNFLRCDCHLRWMVKWSKSKQVRIPSSTVCALPKAMKGRIFSKLKRADLHCDHDLQLPYFEITPSHSQVVFEGDKLPFECSASVLHLKTNITWIRGNVPMTSNKTAGIFVHTQFTPDKTRITHSLVVENLDKSHSGQWYCQVATPQGKVSQGVNISVISNQNVYCPEVMKVTNKGNYSFEKTVAGIKVGQPCKSPKTKIATYNCNRFGYWEELDILQCSYMSEMTRQLERLASEDFNSTDIYQHLADLERVYSVPKPKEFGVMDVVFLARIIEKLQDHLWVGSELYQIIVSKVSSISMLQDSVLRSAQLQEQASTRFVRVLMNISNMVEIEPPLKEWSKFSRNIAITVLQEPRADPSRIHCTLRKLKKRKNNTNNPFTCNRLGNNTETPVKPSENCKLSLVLPPTLFEDAGLYYEDTVNIQIIVYRDGSLFPSTTTVRKDPVFGDKNWSVVSNVVTVSVGRPVLNLSEPAILYFDVRNTRKPLVAAYWDFDANGGLGDWKSDGCDIMSSERNITTVYCYHLATFTLLQDDTEYIIRESFVMEPVIYVGSCLCMLCMMIVIISYITCFRVIYIPKKLKHSVINICISVHLLIVAFTLGINRTDLELPCQISGICIHYFTLCTVFWITITSNNMYKKFTKADKPPEPPPELINMPLPPKPILRFYFLGWGVPIIICGITAAVNFNHYSGIKYCFLSWEPSLGAFYGPITLLVVLNLLFFLRISCVIRGVKVTAGEGEDCTEELHVNEIELVPSQADTNLEIQALTPRRQQERERERIKDEDEDDDDDNGSTLSVMDQERRPITQLRAIVTMLFLCILVWVCGAIAVAKPFKSIIPYQELIFSYLYGLTATGFGVYMVVYFCWSRKDSRLSWKRFFGCVTPELYSMPVNTEPPPPPSPQVNGNIIKSNSNMNLSTHSQKSTNIEKAINMKQNQNSTSKQSNINLVPQSNSSVTEVSANSAENVPSFYNPRQNGAAKKFWDKHKHKQGKVMNKDANRDINCSSVSDELSRQYSHGSDANTHLSIEIQIQQANGGVYGQTMTPNFQPNRMTNHFKNGHMYMDRRNHMTPVGAPGSEHGTASPVSHVSSHILPQHQRSSSSCSVGSRPSAFTTVQPRNNTLPRPNKGEVIKGPPSPNPPNNNNYMNREGSVPRLRDFDGQSQTSGSGHQDPCKSPRPHNGGPYLQNQGNQYPNQSRSPVPHPNTDIKRGRQSPHNSSRSSPYSYRQSPYNRPMSGEYSSDTSSKRSRGRVHYFREAPIGSYNPVVVGTQSAIVSDSQRCRNVNPRYLSPPDSDSQVREQQTPVRAPETDHHSDPTHRKRHRSSRDKRHSHKVQGMRKQKSLGWDNEFAGRPAKMYSYAYVNHNYRDRVLRKLIKQASESDELAQKAFWLPRSMSEYDRLCQSGFCNTNMVEDSSTSSDDDQSSYDIWVPQNQDGSSDFKKKETSV